MKTKCIFGLSLGAFALTASLSSCSGRGASGIRSDEAKGTKNLTELVDPLIGTDWVGNIYPGASAPFGMVQLSPDNGLPGWDRISGYYYPDSTIAGFSHTHLSGTGAGDLYDVSFMPVTLPALNVVSYHKGDAESESEGDRINLGIHAKFSHESERAMAGYYSVLLEPYKIRVDLTATPHVGIQRYTFEAQADTACIILNLEKAMNWDKTVEAHISYDAEAKSLSGHRYSDGWARDQRVYFYSELSRAPERVDFDDKKQKAYAYYTKVQAGDELVITTALSGVDLEGAKLNHKAEAGHFDFGKYLSEAQAEWSKQLELIEIPKDTPQELQRTFYTALYRSQLCPTLYSDVDGRYLGADRQIHRTEGGAKHYSTFSLWDTYRSAHPLYNLIAPERNKDMVQSLIDFGHQNSGHLPVWTMWAGETDMMIGYHSVPIIAEAIQKSVYPVQDKTKLIALLRSTAERQGYRGLDAYRSLGFVPLEEQEESVSKTLEYAYDDACIATIGEALGDKQLADEYRQRSLSYRNLWQSERGFFVPRHRDGSWIKDFDPFAYTKHFTESNAYQYLFSAQHDPEGLIQLMGGINNLAHRLDELFNTPTPSHIELPIFSTGMLGQYAHGNEPIHHNIFLYNLARQPWKTARLSRKVCLSLYHDRPDGLCGNEDCGQMSAWYIFASMGFYPLDPVSGRYELTAPLFPLVRLHLPSGKYFTIKANVSEKQAYIKSVKVNGKPYQLSYLTHDLITSGATVELEMTDQEGICWY